MLHFDPANNRDLGRLFGRLRAPALSHLDVTLYSEQDFEVFCLARPFVETVTSVCVEGLIWPSAAVERFCALMPAVTEADLGSSVRTSIASVKTDKTWNNLSALVLCDPLLEEVEDLLNAVTFCSLSLHYPYGRPPTMEQEARVRRRVEHLRIEVEWPRKWFSQMY